MVFLIQNTQNRDSRAVQLKLDELIRATKGARNQYVVLEDLSDDDLSELNKEFKELTQKPGTVRAMQKLHERIDNEHKRRTSISDLIHYGSRDSAKKSDNLWLFTDKRL